jgi:enterochelin esterase-like enzyme
MPPNAVRAVWLTIVCLVVALAGCAPTEGAESPTLAAPAASVTPSPPPEAQARATATPGGGALNRPVQPTQTATPAQMQAPTASPTATATPCQGAGEVVAGSFPSATAGGNHRYRLYLPPCYQEDGRVYPALYLFAGNIHNEGKWTELGMVAAAEAAIAAQEIAPMLIVMPDGGWLANETSGGPGSYETLVLSELVPHIEATTCAWREPAGRAIGGLSRGGYWALEIAFRFPDRFASVGGHSAALLDTFAGPDVNPQQTALTSELGALRIYLDIGVEDHVRANTIRLHDDMEAAGIAHEWRLSEGRHNDEYWSNHAADYLRWYAAPWSLNRSDYPPCAAP